MHKLNLIIEKKREKSSFSSILQSERQFHAFYPVKPKSNPKSFLAINMKNVLLSKVGYKIYCFIIDTYEYDHWLECCYDINVVKISYSVEKKKHNKSQRTNSNRFFSLRPTENNNLYQKLVAKKIFNFI